MRRCHLLALFMVSCASRTTPVVTSSKVPIQPTFLAQPSPTTVPVSVETEKPKVEPLARKIARRRILLVGDSEACAVAPQVKNVKLPTDTVDVSCEGGTVIQQWGFGGKFKAALSRHPKPDAVLIFLGTNHYWQKKVPPVDQILSQIKDSNCVWVGNTAVHGKSWEINGLIRDAVSSRCDYFDTEAANIPLWDGVHPDATGALLWLQKVWPTIPLKYESEPGNE